MSFKEVTQLRKSGKLKEACEMAKADLEKAPNDIWSKRALAWVYYEYLKKHVLKNDTENSINYLEQIKTLELPEDEKLLYNSLAWQIGKLLFNANNINENHLDRIFNVIKSCTFTKPEEHYSFLLKAFTKHAVEWKNYLQFIEWWNLENFREEDYTGFVTDEGRKLLSPVENVYIKVAKILLQQNDREGIKAFIPKIAQLAKNRKEMQYPPYYYAKLLIATGNKEKFLKAFSPFARKKSRNFWVWDLMSEGFEPESDEYFSCLCKSLMCGAPDKFTINVREKIAEVFVRKNMLPEAKFEYEKIIAARNNEGWPLQAKHQEWTRQNWWNNTKASQSNTKIYEQNQQLATNLLYADKPEHIAVIEYVNKNKKTLYFVVSKTIYGFAHYHQFNIEPATGDIFAIRFKDKEDNKSNSYKILTIKKTDKTPLKEIYKPVEGEIKIKQGNSFGFVGNVFVHPNIIAKHNFINGQKIAGIALQTYNNKRKSWGWNLVKIKKN